jgi:hypothetical protein
VEVDSAARTLPPGVIVTGPSDAANQSLQNTPGWVGGECVNTFADLADYLKCYLAVIRGLTSPFPFNGKVGAYQIDTSGVPADARPSMALGVAQAAISNAHRWLDHHAADLPGRPRQIDVTSWQQGERQLSEFLRWLHDLGQPNRKKLNGRGEKKGLKTKGKRGRIPDTDEKRDQRISDVWKAGHFKRYADLAREMNIEEYEVKAAIDRVRHRKSKENTPE